MNTFTIRLSSTGNRGNDSSSASAELTNRVLCNKHRRSTYPLLSYSVSRSQNVTVFWQLFFNNMHFFSNSFLYTCMMAYLS